MPRIWMTASCRGFVFLSDADFLPGSLRMVFSGLSFLPQAPDFERSRNISSFQRSSALPETSDALRRHPVTTPAKRVSRRISRPRARTPARPFRQAEERTLLCSVLSFFTQKTRPNIKYAPCPNRPAIEAASFRSRLSAEPQKAPFSAGRSSTCIRSGAVRPRGRNTIHALPPSAVFTPGGRRGKARLSRHPSALGVGREDCGRDHNEGPRIRLNHFPPAIAGIKVTPVFIVC